MLSAIIDSYEINCFYRGEWIVPNFEEIWPSGKPRGRGKKGIDFCVAGTTQIKNKEMSKVAVVAFQYLQKGKPALFLQSTTAHTDSSTAHNIPHDTSTNNPHTQAHDNIEVAIWIRANLPWRRPWRRVLWRHRNIERPRNTPLHNN